MVDRQASEWREVCYTRSTICGMAAAEAVAVAVITTGGECVSLEVQTARAAVCQGRAGQGRARSAIGRVLSCPRERESTQRGRVHITKRGASLRQQPLLDVSTRITTTDNRGSLAAGRYHIIIGTSPVTPHHRGLIRLTVAISSSLRRVQSSAMHAYIRDS